MKRVIMFLLMVGLLVAGSAQAAPLSSAFVPGVINTVSDDNGEVLVNIDGSGGISPLTGAASPTLTVGDYLVGVFGITSFPTSGANPTTTNEMTGIYALQVTGVVGPLPDSLAFPNLTGGVPVVTGATANFSFAPVAAGFNAAVAAAFGLPAFTDLNGDPLPANTIGIFFEGSPNDYARSNPGDVNGNLVPNEIADAVMAATNGTGRMIVGPGLFWQAGYGPVYINDALIEASLSPTGVGQVGAFSADLTILQQNFPGLTLGPSLTLTNGAFSGDVSNPTQVPWPITSNVDLQFNVQGVPEPGTLSMLGAGLLGLWFVGRRSRKS